MKKCKVTVAGEGSRTKYFYLFPESTLIHSLVMKSTKKNLSSLLKSHPEVEIITLRRGQWLEVEWNGCHINYDSGRPISASSFRLIKATSSPKKSQDGSLLSVHFGWMLTDHLRMITHSTDDINVELLKDQDDQFEFSELFQDNETTEDILKRKMEEKEI